MNALDGLLQGIVDDPHAEDRWVVLADWLEEHDDPRRAELLRFHLRLRGTCCDPDLHPERAAQQARLVQLLKEGVRPCVPQRTVLLGASVAMTFAWVPPGSFLMGSPPSEAERNDNETQHRVTLTKGFFLGIYPVTQAQWRAVMGDNPSYFKGDDLPVEMVSYADCLEFCAKLSVSEGKTCRLPTEANWEYACRAGTTTPFSFGETISTQQANYHGNYPYREGKKGKFRRETMPAGSFPPNAWGLCDMHGNVWEWCQDGCVDYPKNNSTDPQNSNNGAARVLRGGSWSYGAWYCRSAYRDSRYAPGDRDRNFGFRACVCLD